MKLAKKSICRLRRSTWVMPPGVVMPQNSWQLKWLKLPSSRTVSGYVADSLACQVSYQAERASARLWPDRWMLSGA